MIAAFVGLALLLGACARPDTPAVPVGSDAALFEGRDIYINSCATCHGSAGGGGRGKKLADGQVFETYPDFDDNVEHVKKGRKQMPAYEDKLTEDQIIAVARYTREILAVPSPEE